MEAFRIAFLLSLLLASVWSASCNVSFSANMTIHYQGVTTSSGILKTCKKDMS